MKPLHVHIPVDIYFDFNDWWIGYYRGEKHHYLCLLPTLVIRWNRKVRICAAWWPPDGSYGRDTHICGLHRGHEDKHKCKCRVKWEGPRRHVRTR